MSDDKRRTYTAQDDTDWTLLATASDFEQWKVETGSVYEIPPRDYPAYVILSSGESDFATYRYLTFWDLRDMFARLIRARGGWRTLPPRGGQ